MIILDSCPNVIRSFAGAPRSSRNPEDVDESYTDDHAADAFRYLITGLMRHRSLTDRRRGRGQAAGVRGTTSGIAGVAS